MTIPKSIIEKEKDGLKITALVGFFIGERTPMILSEFGWRKYNIQKG